MVNKVRIGLMSPAAMLRNIKHVTTPLKQDYRVWIEFIEFVIDKIDTNENNN